ncbi:MAG: hypothetical protein ACE5LU_07170 [Anaerolineae bacterium]
MVVGVGAAVLVAVALLVISPGFRAAAAQAVGEIRQLLGGGIATGPEGISTFRPAPPFNVKQPDYLPEGFKLTAQRYNPGPDPRTGRTGVSVIEKEVKPQSAGPAAQEATERDRGSEPYIVLVYEAGDGRYVQLFERAARQDEVLPAGEPRTVAGQPARLQHDGPTLLLTWIEEGTWIELQGRLSEAELLRIAGSLVTTQRPGGVVDDGTAGVAPTSGEHDLPVSVMGYPPEDFPYCNPEYHVPSGPEPLLGNVPGQRRKGRITIQIMDPELYPFPESVSYGASVKNVRDEVFTPALAALRDPSVPMQRLPYPSLSFKLSEARGCYEPDPMKELGYVVIEVWDDQVNIGYGGAGAALKERAIKALKERQQEVAQTPVIMDDVSERPAPVVPTSDKPIPAATREALHRAVRELLKLPYCNPEDRVPPGPLVGEVKGQQLKGWVKIQLWDHHPVGEYETLGYSIDPENRPKNVREEVLEPALAALRDPTAPMRRLSYPSLGFRLSDSGQCLEPDPNEQGYVVIEVWDNQVNIGYGGAGAVLKDRAIRGLEQHLQKMG